MTAPQQRPDLTQLGQVSASYQHHQRLVEPGADVVVPGARLKWYTVQRPDMTVPSETDRQARQTVQTALERGEVRPDYGLGVVILHLSDPLSYLIVGAWRANQELWETLFIRQAGQDVFEPARPGVDAPTLCVWELAPVWHERQAWVRYLESKRDERSVRAFLDDRLQGLV